MDPHEIEPGAERRSILRSTAVDWQRENRRQFESWMTETIKHLAFVNAEGLARSIAWSA